MSDDQSPKETKFLEQGKILNTPSEIANCKPENHKSSNDKLLESPTKVLTTYREMLESQ
jgi:hypothetical protein